MARKYLDLDHAMSAVHDAAGSRHGRWPRAAASAGRRTSRSAKPRRPSCRIGRDAALERLDGPAVDRCTRREHSAERPDADRADRGRQRYGQRLRTHPQPARESRRRQDKQGVARCSIHCCRTAASSSIGWRSSRRSMTSAPMSTPARISTCRCCCRDFDRGVALLADNELHPALPPAGHECDRQAARAGGRRQQSTAPAT